MADAVDLVLMLLLAALSGVVFYLIVQALVRRSGVLNRSLPVWFRVYCFGFPAWFLLAAAVCQTATDSASFSLVFGDYVVTPAFSIITGLMLYNIFRRPLEGFAPLAGAAIATPLLSYDAWLGFAFYVPVDLAAPSSYFAIVLLAWHVPTAAGLYAASLVPRKITEGHCPKCGYDLTGLATSVCPECGETIRAGSASAHCETPKPPGPEED